MNGFSGYARNRRSSASYRTGGSPSRGGRKFERSTPGGITSMRSGSYWSYRLYWSSTSWLVLATTMLAVSSANSSASTRCVRRYFRSSASGLPLPASSRSRFTRPSECPVKTNGMCSSRASCAPA